MMSLAGVYEYYHICFRLVL